MLIESNINVSGNYQNLRIGSTTMITCTTPMLMGSTITWLDQDGSVVSNSGVLTLQSVDYTINGSVFTCSVNSSYFASNTSLNQTIVVTIQSNSDAFIIILFTQY